MIERDRVWWCWWKGKGIWAGNYIACGYSRYAMDVRRGVYRNRRVEYEADAFDDALPRRYSRAVEFAAAGPNGFREYDRIQKRAYSDLAKLDIDRAVNMGLQPPEWRDDLPADRAISAKDHADAVDVIFSDVGPEPPAWPRS